MGPRVDGIASGATRGARAREVTRTLTGAIAREHAPETDAAAAIACSILSRRPRLLARRSGACGDLKTWRAR